MSTWRKFPHASTFFSLEINKELRRQRSDIKTKKKKDVLGTNTDYIFARSWLYFARPWVCFARSWLWFARSCVCFASSLGWFARFWSSPARPTRTLHSPQRNAALCPTQVLCGTHLSNSHPLTIPRAQPPPRLPAGPLEHKSKSGSRKTKSRSRKTNSRSRKTKIRVCHQSMVFMFFVTSPAPLGTAIISRDNMQLFCMSSKEHLLLK